MTPEQKAEKLRISLNYMYMFADIADAYALDVEDMLKLNNLYRNSDKMVINRIKSLTKALTRSVDKVLTTDESRENFGADCDFIREVCELCAKSKTEEQNIKILSVLKLIVK